MRMNFALYALLVTGAIFAALGWVGFSSGQVTGDQKGFAISMAGGFCWLLALTAFANFNSDIYATDWETQLRSVGVGHWQSAADLVEGGIHISKIQGADIDQYYRDGKFLHFGSYSGGTGISGKNEGYSFDLRKTESLSAYSLVGLNTVDSNTMDPQATLNLHIETLNIRRFFVHVSGVWDSWSLLDVIDDPRFAVVSVDEVILDGRLFLDFNWRFSDPTHETTSRPGQKSIIPVFPSSGTFRVEPEQQWRLISYNGQMFENKPNEFTFSGVLSGHVDIEGVLLPTVIVLQCCVASPEDARTTRIEQQISRNFDDELFYLPHYELPEPSGFKRNSPGWPWWIKLSVAGIVAVGIAALFKLSINKGKK